MALYLSLIGRTIIYANLNFWKPSLVNAIVNNTAILLPGSAAISLTPRDGRSILSKDGNSQRASFVSVPVPSHSCVL